MNKTQDILEDFVFDSVQVTLDFMTESTTAEALKQDVTKWIAQHNLLATVTFSVADLAGPSGWPMVTFVIEGKSARKFIRAYNELD